MVFHGFLWFSHSNTTQTPSESPIFSAISAGPVAGLADGVQGLSEGGKIPRDGHRPTKRGGASVFFGEEYVYYCWIL